jgi:hypothetical protein
VTFLSPLTAILAGAIGASLLLLLYVLRLRRRVVRMPSTMFWPGVREDLEVNTPFQRLRATPLLLLQMLALLLLAAALGEPVIDAGPEPSGRTIIMIDRSASMSAPADAAAPGGATRLDVTLDAVRAEIDRRTTSRGGRDPGEVMLIAFGSRPQVVRGFERRPGPLLDALRDVGPSDGEADLEAAMQLASAFLVSGEESGDEPPEVLLFTDGGTAPPRRQGPTLLTRATLDVRSPVRGWSAAGADGAEAVPSGGAAGPPPAFPNVGIVACSARRGDREPELARLFARVANAGPVAVRVQVRIDRDDIPVRTEELEVPAATVDGPAGEATIAVDVAAPEASLLRVAITRIVDVDGDPVTDLLAADDVAAVRLPPAASPRIVVVSPDARPFGPLAALLDATGPSTLRRVDAAGWQRMIDADETAEVDLVVFDRAAAAALPGIPSLWFGARPPGIDRVSDRPAEASGEGGDAGTGQIGADPDPDADADADPDRGRRVLSWRRTHPALRYVALDEVAFAGFDAFVELPRGEVLARGIDGPVMLEVPAAGASHILVGFALDRTNWTTDVGFAVFVQNAISHLAATGRGQAGRAVRPGEPVSVRLPAGTEAGREVTVTGPVSFELTTGDRPDLLLPGLVRAGTYAVSLVDPPDDLVAVNVASLTETDLRPRPVVSVRARETRSGLAESETPQDLWPWFVAAAGLLATVEWLLYARMLRG